MLCIPKVVWLMEDPENVMIGCTCTYTLRIVQVRTCSIMVRPDCVPMNNFLDPLMCNCHNSFGRQPNLLLMELMGWLLKGSSWLTALNYETNWPVIPYHWTGPLDGVLWQTNWDVVPAVPQKGILRWRMRNGSIGKWVPRKNWRRDQLLSEGLKFQRSYP